MDYTENGWKLAIAKLAYKEISEVIERLEATEIIHAHWDECITVDEELFHGHQLRDGE